MPDPDERIGGSEPQVLRRLDAWLAGSNDLTDAQAEVARHVVEHPEPHIRDVNAIIDRKLTFRGLREAFESSDPKAWGYPADSWDAVARVAELRRRTVLDADEAVVRTLVERGRSSDEIATMLDQSIPAVDDLRHRADERVAAARNTVELLDENVERREAR